MGFDVGDDFWWRGEGGERDFEEFELALVEVVVVTADYAAVEEGATGREDETGTAIDCLRVSTRSGRVI
jgi:hypothetical protein